MPQPFEISKLVKDGGLPLPHAPKYVDLLELALGDMLEDDGIGEMPRQLERHKEVIEVLKLPLPPLIQINVLLGVSNFIYLCLDVILKVEILRVLLKRNIVIVTVI